MNVKVNDESSNVFGSVGRQPTAIDDARSRGQRANSATCDVLVVASDESDEVFDCFVFQRKNKSHLREKLSLASLSSLVVACRSSTRGGYRLTIVRVSGLMEYSSQRMAAQFGLIFACRITLPQFSTSK
jgi:hypothetical protein